MSRDVDHLDGRHDGGQQTIKQRALREVRSFLVLFLYLWVLLGLFRLSEAVAARQHGEAIVLQGFAVVNALVLAKVMLVIEDLELARWIRAKPTIVVILYEAIVCTLLFLCFHVVERLVVDGFRGGAVSANDLSVGGGGVLGVVIVAVILFVSLLPFFAFKNVARAIGTERMRRILFDKPDETT